MLVVELTLKVAVAVSDAGISESRYTFVAMGKLDVSLSNVMSPIVTWIHAPPSPHVLSSLSPAHTEPILKPPTQVNASTMESPILGEGLPLATFRK